MAVTYTDANKVSARIQGKWTKEVMLTSDSGVSETNKDEVYTTDTSQFTIGDGVRITSTGEKTGEDKIVDSISEDVHIKLTTNMTKDYTTAQNGRIQIKRMFDNRSQPSLSEVEDLINENEDDIDSDTRHAWREVTVTEEYHDIYAMFRTLTGVPTKLLHRKIKAFGGTDKIEVWDGQAWTDWVATKTEGRNNDYWCNYTDGIFYLRMWFVPYRQFALRITYRFGETTIPKDIQKACTLLTAADVLDNENFVAKHPAGDLDNISVSSKQERWRKKAAKIIDKHKELMIL